MKRLAMVVGLVVLMSQTAAADESVPYAKPFWRYHPMDLPESVKGPVLESCTKMDMLWLGRAVTYPTVDSLRHELRMVMLKLQGKRACRDGGLHLHSLLTHTENTVMLYEWSIRDAEKKHLSPACWQVVSPGYKYYESELWDVDQRAHEVRQAIKDTC